MDSIEQHYLQSVLLNENRGTDELHIGGKVATEYLLAAMDLKPDMAVLDVGCGLGAAARAAARLYKVRVTGIDLMPEFTALATQQTAKEGLTPWCDFMASTALDIPYPAETFEAAFMLHVNMNIEEKQSLFNGISRILRKGSQFGFYEILADHDVLAMIYPNPWADSPDDSFLINSHDLNGILANAGFSIEVQESRRDFALETLTHFTKKHPEPAVVNLLENIRQNRCAPWQYICRKI